MTRASREPTAGAWGPHRRRRPRVRVLHVGEGQPAAPEAFSADILVFDQEPRDAELAVLLGRWPHLRPRRRETPEGFRVREPGLKLWWVAGWMLFVASLACGMLLWGRDDPWSTRVILCVLVFAAAAGVFAMFWGVDGHLRAQPDDLCLNRGRGVLEAPGSGLRVPVAEVIACVRLKRWWSDGSARGGDVVQLGVLVPAGPEHPGRVAYHPLTHELVMAGPRDRVIDGVIEELGRPVRRIHLTLDEVRALGRGR